jgi:hypothetical protein
MELFVVKNKSGTVVANGFTAKHLAKTARNELQEKEGGGLPPLDQRQKQDLWSFRVSRGKDHGVQAVV